MTGVECGEKLDAGGPIANLLEDLRGGDRQKRGKAIGYISRWPNENWVVAREVEVAGVQPEAIALFIESDDPSGAIHDRSSYAERLRALGLHGPGTGFKRLCLEQLQPGHPPHQAEQPKTEQGKHPAHASNRDGLQRHNPPTG